MRTLETGSFLEASISLLSKLRCASGRYVPRKLRPLGDGPLTPSHPLHGVAPYIKERMQQDGSALIGFQAIHGLPNFFRWVWASPDAVSTQLVDEVLELIASLGEQWTTKA